MIHAEESSLSKLKLNSESKSTTLQKMESRQKAALIFTLNHLRSHGYHQSLDKLQQESGVSLSNWCVADNMDLVSIFQEFEDYYHFKFGKYPKLYRKILEEKKSSVETIVRNGGKSELKLSPTKPRINKAEKSQSTATLVNEERHTPTQLELTPSTTSLQSRPAVIKSQETKSLDTEDPHHYESKLLKPPPFFGGSELKDLADIISKDIYIQNPNVKWTDISGLHRSKKILKEAVIFPMKYPELFKGLLTSWKGALLYGPSGTGKTMLAKAVATECNTTFFNISASSIVSKWRGDSEKLVRVLFELARHHAPSTIFLDEIESIMGHRAAEGEHEGSRRMKTELLIQMDGLSKTDSQVFILAASNLPWDLDTAMLRRLEKRILIDLPDCDSRCDLFSKMLPLDSESVPVEVLNYEKLAELTDGYSGADITLLCKEAAMTPLRKLLDWLESDNTVELVRDRVTMENIKDAIKITKPASDASIQKKYRQWQQDYGSN